MVSHIAETGIVLDKGAFTDDYVILIDEHNTTQDRSVCKLKALGN